MSIARKANPFGMRVKHFWFEFHMKPKRAEQVYRSHRCKARKHVINLNIWWIHYSNILKTPTKNGWLWFVRCISSPRCKTFEWKSIGMRLYNIISIFSSIYSNIYVSMWQILYGILRIGQYQINIEYEQCCRTVTMLLIAKYFQLVCTKLSIKW